MWQYNNELYHFGIKGQKWGIRRYQNPDGSLTEEGRKRYQKQDGSLTIRAEKHIRNNIRRIDAPWENRSKLLNKMESELRESKEGKDYSDLLNRRRILTVRDKKGNIVKQNFSYADYDDMDKMLEAMTNDLAIEKKYREKSLQITKKYLNEYGGAILRDFGYEDTAAGRQYLIDKEIIKAIY